MELLGCVQCFVLVLITLYFASRESLVRVYSSLHSTMTAVTQISFMTTVAKICVVGLSNKSNMQPQKVCDKVEQCHTPAVIDGVRWRCTPGFRQRCGSSVKAVCCVHIEKKSR
jgi:hypothetical protein